MAFRAASAQYNGTTAVTSFTLTCPTGTVSTDTIYILANTATSTVAGHTATGFTPEGLNGRTISTSSKHTILEGTGHVAGDVVTVNCPASGISGGQMVVYDNTTTRDAIGTVATSGSPATETVPGLTTTEDSELVICFSVALFTAARTVNSVSPGTIRDSLSSGGGIRWFAAEISDQVVTSAGASGSVTVVHSGTITGFTGILISHKSAGTPTDSGVIAANAVATCTIAGTTVGGTGGFTGWGIPL